MGQPFCTEKVICGAQKDYEMSGANDPYEKEMMRLKKLYDELTSEEEGPFHDSENVSHLTKRRIVIQMAVIQRNLQST
nr:unnamed protein product [Callosobruchus analis]